MLAIHVESFVKASWKSTSPSTASVFWQQDFRLVMLVFGGYPWPFFSGKTDVFGVAKRSPQKITLQPSGPGQPQSESFWGMTEVDKYFFRPLFKRSVELMLSWLSQKNSYTLVN